MSKQKSSTAKLSKLIPKLLNAYDNLVNRYETLLHKRRGTASYSRACIGVENADAKYRKTSRLLLDVLEEITTQEEQR